MAAESNVNERHDMIIACTTSTNCCVRTDAWNVWKKEDNS